MECAHYAGAQDDEELINDIFHTSSPWTLDEEYTHCPLCPGKQMQELTSLETIEERTRRKVTIIRDENEAVGKCNEQEACPLFAFLPPEIRQMIWAFATAPYEDPNGKFDEREYYCRPGHTARLKTDTALLRTCRRIWLEANALPELQAEHCFYYHRAAPDARDPAWMASLTADNRANLGHLHLFAQMFAIERLDSNEGRLRQFFLLTERRRQDFQPRMLHVTIRHTDWWFWEDEEPLRLEYHWVQALLDSVDLRSTETLRLELETLDYKAHQLQPIVERIKRLESPEKETHIIDGRVVKTKFELVGEPKVFNWEGPADIDQQSFNPYVNRTTLKYHVVTLTWKLRFPELPNAFIPTIRRAPTVLDQTLHHSLDEEPDRPRGIRYATGNLPEGGDLSRIYRRYPSKIKPPRRRGTMNKAYFQRLITEFQLQQVGQQLATAHEWNRREQFLEQFAKITVDQCRERWSARKSLLKFVELSDRT